MMIAISKEIIDQRGCFETSRPTTHTDPTYAIDGVIHLGEVKNAFVANNLGYNDVFPENRLR